MWFRAGYPAAVGALGVVVACALVHFVLAVVRAEARARGHALTARWKRRHALIRGAVGRRRHETPVRRSIAGGATTKVSARKARLRRVRATGECEHGEHGDGLGVL